MSQTPLLEMRGISKAFAGVPALSGVDFCVNPGEVMGLAGQNGAGKSTLIKILTGVYQRDSGRVLFGGTEINPHSPREAQAAGISTIYQELNLVPNLCVAENISLGREIYKKGILDWNATYERAETVLSSLGISVNVRETVSEQSVAIQQMIAIARAVSFDAKLIVMDEPTSSLEDSEVKILLGLIKNLKARGISVVFVTHRLDEMFKVCDRITVLRDGKLEGDYAIGELDKLSLILKMIGKSKEEFSFISTRSLVTHEDEKAEDVLLELKNVKLDNRLLDVSFVMNKGEVLGVTGLLGAGKTETAKSIFGAIPEAEGKIMFNGKVAKKRSPARSVGLGIGFVPEDRKSEGILPHMSVRENISIVLLSELSRLGLVNKRKENEIVKAFVEKLNIKAASLDQEARTLSGGNQQKLLLARWLCKHPELLILDEPTRGIDVGAKLDVQKLIKQMAKDGVSVLMINTELDELVRSCDRVLVMRVR